MNVIKLFTSDYGQTIRCRTYASDISSATCTLRWKKQGAVATYETDDTNSASLSATTVVGDVDDEGEVCYSVDAVITSGFLAAKAGTWICQLAAAYANATVTSRDAFKVVVEARPT